MRLITTTSVLIMALASSPAVADDGTVHSRGALSDLQTATVEPTDGAWAVIAAIRTADQTTVVLNLKDLDRAYAGVTYGAHVHSGTCQTGIGAAAGPHFNIDVYNGSVTPVVSEDTEVWLDFTVTEGGTGHAQAIVPFAIPGGAASAIVIHAMPTAPNGTAGARLACIAVEF